LNSEVSLVHELSLAIKLLEVVKTEALKQGMHRVKEVAVSHGNVKGYDPDRIREAIALMQTDSLLSEAEILFLPGESPGFMIERITGE